MQCELGCDAPAVAFLYVLGVRRHVCAFCATGRGAPEDEEEQERSTLTRPAVPETHKDQDFDQEKYTRQRRQRPR